MSAFAGIGGSFGSERVVGLDRNHCPQFGGISGMIAAESVAGMGRNPRPSHHTRCVPDYLGVLAVPLILGPVEVAKRRGMDTTWAQVVAVFLGLALPIGWQVATVIPGGQVWVQAVVWGLKLGLAASGSYSGVKKVEEE